MNKQPRVGFIGLGSQGAPMALRIVEDGFPTALWARRPESLAPFADTPARIVSTRRELGATSDILCVCVVADADVDGVLRGDDGALAAMSPGGVVVIHSTVHPETCRRIQADFPRLTVLDAPVSGGGHMATERRLVVMVGGDPDALRRCEPVFRAYADPLVHLGPLGAGQEAKLLNNALFTANLGTAADTYAIASARGIDPEALARVISAGSARSYGAEVLAITPLDVLAQLAGSLLSKDVRLLARLLEPELSHLIAAAEATLSLMGVAADRDPGSNATDSVE